MIIKGDHKKAMEISQWLQTDYGLKWPDDFSWLMLPFSRNTKIKFEFKDSSIATMVALRYMNEGT